MRLKIHYGNQPVFFELIRKNVKHINLTVHPDQTIFVLHTRFPDHDYHFFSNLQLLMPDWKERKRILDEEVAREV